jgi:hypothetical protein
MTMILVDPFELNTASETLRSCAAETADIGTQLWACAQCAMPAEINATVNALVATADRVLDATAANLSLRSTDLANRAAIAANDPVAASTVATSPTTSGVWGVIGGMNIVGGNSGPGFTIVGGTNPYAGTSIVGGGGPFGDGAGFFTGGGFSAIGTTTIGGGGPFGDGSGFYTGLGTGSRRFDGPMGGVMALAQTAQNFRESAQARIDRIVRNPQTTPTEFRIAMNAQWGLGDSVSHTLAPSVSALEAQYGPLSDGQIEAISPHTLFRPTNIFAGV